MIFVSSTSDAVILMFLGMAMVNYAHVWHTGFVLWTLGLCLVCRVLGVYLLALVHNSTSERWINLRDQTVLAYCGLRGALCLCLAHMLNGTRVPHKSLFVTTTLVVILFTTLVQVHTNKIRVFCYTVKILRLKFFYSVVTWMHKQIRLCKCRCAGVNMIPAHEEIEVSKNYQKVSLRHKNVLR